MQAELVHFPLHPETPPPGKSLEELFAGRGYDMASMQAQMRARMQAEGLPEVQPGREAIQQLVAGATRP